MFARKTIEENAAGMDTSFIGRLHEEGVWDEKAFWCLYDALNALAIESSVAKAIDRELARKVSKINSYALNSVLQSHDTNDLFKIRNIDQGLLSDFIERLNQAVDGFFRGTPPKEESFDDELRHTEN